MVLWQSPRQIPGVVLHSSTSAATHGCLGDEINQLTRTYIVSVCE